MVIEMACTSEPHTNQLIGIIEVVECEEDTQIERSDCIDDEESRKYRKYIAQQDALHQLEQLKAKASAATYMISFIIS